MTLFYAFTLSLILNTFIFSIYISCYFHLWPLQHLLLCHCYFCSFEIFISFSFWRYLIINLNPKNFNVIWANWLISLALWSDRLLGLWIRGLNLSWRPCDLNCYFVWSYWGIPQDIVLFVCLFVCMLFWLHADRKSVV